MIWRREIEPPVQEELLRIGREVRAARGALGLTQQELERLSGVDQSTISRLENGLAPGLPLRSLARLQVGFLGRRLLPFDTLARNPSDSLFGWRD